MCNVTKADSMELSLVRDGIKLEATNLALCTCGAVTLDIEGNQFSMFVSTFKKKFGIDEDKILTKDMFEFNYVNCNHCVNNWGEEFCACGSGQLVGECDDDNRDCGTQYYDIESSVKAIIMNKFGGSNE